MRENPKPQHYTRVFCCGSNPGPSVCPRIVARSLKRYQDWKHVRKISLSWEYSVSLDSFSSVLFLIGCQCHFKFSTCFWATRASCTEDDTRVEKDDKHRNWLFTTRCLGEQQKSSSIWMPKKGRRKRKNGECSVLISWTCVALNYHLLVRMPACCCSQSHEIVQIGIFIWKGSVLRKLQVSQSDKDTRRRRHSSEEDGGRDGGWVQNSQRLSAGIPSDTQTGCLVVLLYDHSDAVEGGRDR